jgi:hypothetical protein
MLGEFNFRLYIISALHESEIKLYRGFEVLISVVTKSSVFWDITLCSPVKANRHLGGTYCLHLHE